MQTQTGLMRTTSVVLLLVFVAALITLPPFTEQAEAGWWSCVKAAAACASASYTAWKLCKKARKTRKASDIAACAAAVITAGLKCDKAAKECGL